MSASSQTGERALWTVVLADALLLASGAAGYATAGERRAARRWLHSPSERRGGFVWICQQLNLDPDATRRAIEHPERRAAA